VFEGNRAREQSMAERASSTVNAMSESVESVIKEIGGAATQMAQSIATLTQTTSSSVDRMNAGAELIGTASRNFATAGDRVSGVMEHAASVSAKLVEISGGLTSGGVAMQEVLRDYQSQRSAMTHLVTELRVTVEAARKEAALTENVLSRIESSANLLSAAQKQADEYLNGVNEVLAKTHESFATEITRTLDRANNAFHTKLTTAVSMLSATIRELDTTLLLMGNMPQGKRSHS
jgi:ElaB/YqjD/DUF883 family membrane-anchored ribosome-binding protein